jgi:hypothetical protein
MCAVSRGQSPDLHSVLTAGLSGLKAAGKQGRAATALLDSTKTGNGFNLTKIFDGLSADSKEIIRQNVPFFTRLFCSKSTMLFNYICGKLGQLEASQLTRSGFFNNIVHRPPSYIANTFPQEPQDAQQAATAAASPNATSPIDTPEGNRPSEGCVQYEGKFFRYDSSLALLQWDANTAKWTRVRESPDETKLPAKLGVVMEDVRRRELHEATSLTFAHCENAGQTLFKDQKGRLVLVALKDLGKLCPNLKTLSFEGATQLPKIEVKDSKSLKTINLTGCTKLTHVEVAGCPKLETLKLSAPLPSPDDGKAPVVAKGCPNLRLPDRTWCETDKFPGVTQYVMQYDGDVYRYSGKTGDLLKRNMFGVSSHWHVTSPDGKNLPLRNQHWTERRNPNLPIPTPLSPKKPSAQQHVVDLDESEPSTESDAQSTIDAPVEGPAAAAAVDPEVNRQRLAAATSLTLARTETRSVTVPFSGSCDEKIYVFTDQNGQSVEIKDFKDLQLAKKLTAINMSNSDIDTKQAGTILQQRHIKNIDFSNCQNIKYISATKEETCSSAEEENIGDSMLENLNLSGTRVTCVNIESHPNLKVLQLDGSPNLQGILLRGCAALQTLTLSHAADELRLLDVSGCANLHLPALPKCNEFFELCHKDCPIASSSLPAKKSPPSGETPIRNLMNAAVGENWDHFNDHAGDLDFANLEHPAAAHGGRPKALIPFISARHPLDDPTTWHKCHTSQDADIYARYNLAEDAFGSTNPYFAQITDDYCLTCCPNLQDKEIFFRVFSEQIGDGPGLIVDLHDTRPGGGGVEYLEGDDTGSFGVSNVKEVGETITLENASVLNAAGESKKADITIKISEAMVNGKQFFHVRVKGLPDNHTFSTEVQQRINAEVEQIRQQHSVTVTVAHCNGGLGRAPTHMYMDTIEKVARRAAESGHVCVCDWKQQKLPEVDGKVNLAYVARNMVLTGHAARNVCGQSTGQFKQIKQFAEDMAGVYDTPPPTSTQARAAQPPPGAQPPLVQADAPPVGGPAGTAAVAPKTNDDELLAKATKLTYHSVCITGTGREYVFIDESKHRIIVDDLGKIRTGAPHLQTINMHGSSITDDEANAILCNPTLAIADFSSCSNIQNIHIPEGIAKKSKLTDLDLQESSIESIRIEGSTNLVTLQLGVCLHLSKVHLPGCRGLEILELSDSAHGLRILDVTNCGALEEIHDTSPYSAISELHREGCPATNLPQVQAESPPP